MKAKATGMSRAVDPLGRVVIPKEIRSAMDWNTGDPLAIYVDGDCVILRKESAACIFCQSNDGLIELHGKHICSACLSKLKDC